MKRKKRRIVLGSSTDNLKSKIQNPKFVGFFAVVLAVMFGGAVVQAQPARIPRIGVLAPLSVSSFSGRLEGLRKRLRELGYVEGKNIVIEYRYAEGKLERLPDLAAELVQLKVDVIVTAGLGILPAKKATTTIPIVFGAAADPVGLVSFPVWRDQAAISPDLARCRQI